MVTPDVTPLAPPTSPPSSFLLQMLNQSLLANQRSVARLLLRLQQENRWQESLLRLHWEASLDRWRSSRVDEEVERLR